MTTIKMNAAVEMLTVPAKFPAFAGTCVTAWTRLPLATFLTLDATVIVTSIVALLRK